MLTIENTLKMADEKIRQMTENELNEMIETCIRKANPKAFSPEYIEETKKQIRTISNASMKIYDKYIEKGDCSIVAYDQTIRVYRIFLKVTTIIGKIQRFFKKTIDKLKKV